MLISEQKIGELVLPSRGKLEEYSAFDTLFFYQSWWEELSFKYDITYRSGNFIIHNKRVCNGLSSFKEARLAGWDRANTQELKLSDISQFKKLMDSKTPWDYFYLTYSAEQQVIEPLACLSDLGLKLLKFRSLPNYRVDFKDGWEGYLEGQNKNTRKKIRQKIRMAEKLKMRLVPVVGQEKIQPFLYEFWEYFHIYWKQKVGGSYYDDPLDQAFMLSWFQKLERLGHLKLTKCFIGDKLVNLRCAYFFNQMQYAALTVNTGEYQEYYPGLLSLYLHLKEAADSGIRSVNLEFGELLHKKQLSNHVEERYSLLVPNPKSLKGKLYTKWVQKKYAVPES